MKFVFKRLNSYSTNQIRIHTDQSGVDNALSSIDSSNEQCGRLIQTDAIPTVRSHYHIFPSEW
jgi:hypothetical protein